MFIHIRILNHLKCWIRITTPIGMVLKLMLAGVARTKAAPLSGLTDSTFPAQEGNSSTYQELCVSNLTALADGISCLPILCFWLLLVFS
jgi:hypothetical protein